MRKKVALTALVVVVYLLHQDCWNWSRYEPLVLGFIPVGLAYHAAYAVVASALMWLLVKYAWPSWLEHVERHEEQEANRKP